MKQENQQPVYDTEEYAYNNIDATIEGVEQ